MLRSQQATQLLLAATLCWSSVAAEVALAETITPVLNADFTEGDQVPAAWTLAEGQGRWVDRQILEVTGDGTDAGHWRCDHRFVPGALYRFEVRGRGTPTNGSAILGPVFANRDYRTPSRDWNWVGHVFRVPDDISDSYLRLGHWRAVGSIQYDAVRLRRVMPVHIQVGQIELGDGEQIADGRYMFSGTFSHEGSNYHRPLVGATASFNSDRWVFGSGQHITYRFQLPGVSFRDGHLSFNVNYFVRGGCTAQLSTDGDHWQDVATQSAAGTVDAKLPDGLLPASVLYLRLKSSTDNTSLQVNRIELSAGLNDSPTDAAGQTLFATVDPQDSPLEAQRLSLVSGGSTGKSLRIELKNQTTDDVQALLTATVSGPGSPSVELPPSTVQIAPDGTRRLQIPLTTRLPGPHQLELALHQRGNDARSSRLTLDFNVPEYYREDYGAQIADVGAPGLAVWWCPATHKVARQRAVPERSSAAAKLTAARNDFEAVQIVLRAEEKLDGLTAQVSDLVGPDGARLPAEQVSILRVAYHFVRHPTDRTGVVDHWPDALPPLSAPISLPAGCNQPLWVLVHVPEDAVPGDYRGQIKLQSQQFTVHVPLQLHVWDFALPKTNHVETAFGLSIGNVARYHGLTTEPQKQQVWEMYLKCFSQHRISPYDPVPLNPIRVQFRSDSDPPRAQVDFSSFELAFRRVVDQYHFTGYRLPIQGMGGGTFHARSDPKIGSYLTDTPEYQAMFASYVGQLESFFRDHDWLDLPYVYWFDEPDPKDYQFVAGGFARLKKYAPELRRMLTEQPGDNELTGLVDIWCPVTPNYDDEQGEHRRQQGERFWWYVCTGPKAPYCTLFIDHPATELRVWLWQTWQRDIRGILVWQSNYWTSNAAFPDRPQNPYEDPMGYVSGYSTARGVKRFWGNGDGRFVYPPEAAAVPGLSGPQPVMVPPVSSLRFEMLREGIEDYEMLYLLRDRLQQRRSDLSAGEIKRYEELLQVPESITRDMVTFTTDPAPIYRRRAQIAAAIEQLQPRGK